MNFKHVPFFLFLLFTPVIVQAQWDNPADRYLNAWKQYESASCPLEEDSIRHFVYFSRDREGIRNHPLLTIERFSGAQIMYVWRLLEPEKDRYDFSMIESDLRYLQSHGKTLFVQLQDATFNPKYCGVPDYLLADEYDGGAVYQRNDQGVPDGWVAKRWHPGVQKRFARLLAELGRAFDGEIEGINLQETAVGVSREYDPSFSPEGYAESVKINMLAMKQAFSQSATMLYANFMPGEWLPWEDHGYLRSIYQYGEDIGVGLGGPDLMFRRRGQLNHALALMHEGTYTVPLCIAVQDGNYIGKTGADSDYHEEEDTGSKGHKNIVPLLHAFARDFLGVRYMFWVNQQPYFSTDVAPCFRSEEPGS